MAPCLHEVASEVVDPPKNHHHLTVIRSYLENLRELLGTLAKTPLVQEDQPESGIAFGQIRIESNGPAGLDERLIGESPRTAQVVRTTGVDDGQLREGVRKLRIQLDGLLQELGRRRVGD